VAWHVLAKNGNFIFHPFILSHVFPGVIYTSVDDDLSEVMRRRILGARRRVLGCFYLLSLPYVVQAFVLARRNGCDVMLILSDEVVNINTLNYLEAAGVKAKMWRQSRGQLHVKMLIADDVALVGSYNPTFYGSQYNVEIMIEIDNPRDVDELASFFMRLWRMC